MSSRGSKGSERGGGSRNGVRRTAGRVPSPEYIFEIAIDAEHKLSTNVRRAVRVAAAKDATLVQAPDCDNCIVQYIQRM